MSRKAVKPAKPATKPVNANRLKPDGPVAILAGLGLLLTAYLGIVALSGSKPAFCTAGSSCDLIQSSAWSTLLGVPMAWWGFGLYLLLLIVSVQPVRRPVPRWQRQSRLALIGVAISLYLTTAGWLALGAFCAWCLLSLALLVAILVLLSVRRPEGAPASGWSTWWTNNGALAAAIVLVIGVWQGGLLTAPESPRLRALAEHLTSTGAKFYGASWCPACRDQKAAFGRAGEHLPYVECSPQGQRGPVALACTDAGIEGFPTWIIRGRKYQQAFSTEELERMSAFRWPKPGAN